MKLADYMVEKNPTRPTRVPVTVTQETRERLRDALYREVSSEKIAGMLRLGRKRARAELGAIVEQLVRAGDYPVSSAESMRCLTDDMLDLVLGLGPIESLLSDPAITEIMVNGPTSVFFERDGKLSPARERFSSEEQLRAIVDRIVSPLGRRIDEQSPIVNARLPEGHRVNVVIPPLSMNGTTVTIRKFRATSFTLDELVSMGTLTSPMATLLGWAVRARKNIAVSGGTGGGKTTLLNALSRQIPHSERVITIEDSAELRFDHHPHVVRLEARLANAEGKGAVTIRELVVNALRMRPDRIVVGECRGAEAADMLQAMNTGHDGSLTTLHANSPAEVVPRLVMMVRYGMDLPVEIIEAQIHSALDLIVQQDRMGDGSRRITQIVQRHGGGASDALPKFVPVVEWDRHDREYRWQDPPQWVFDLPYLDIATEREVQEWVRSLPCCS